MNTGRDSVDISLEANGPYLLALMCLQLCWERVDGEESVEGKSTEMCWQSSGLGVYLT
jgi:hypothetical protein